MPVTTPTGYTPTRAQDLVTKTYVDTRANVPVFVQQTQPTGVTVFEWYQTNAAGDIVGHWLYP